MNGDLVFSKRQLGRFPEPGEVEKLIGALVISRRDRDR